MLDLNQVCTLRLSVAYHTDYYQTEIMKLDPEDSTDQFMIEYFEEQQDRLIDIDQELAKMAAKLRK